jgi:hypothetical protein
MSLKIKFNTSILEESMNISRFPLLFPTPEKAKASQEYNSVANGYKSSSNSEITLQTSPINTNQISLISRSTGTYNQYDVNMENGSRICVNPLCSTARSVDLTPSYYCSLCCSQYSREETFSQEEATEQFHSVNGSFFDNNLQDETEIYICCQAYQASESSQISLDFSETVTLIYVKDNACLVQSMTSSRRGYVPKDCISKQLDFVKIPFFPKIDFWPKK